MIDFELTDEQRLIRETARDFDEYIPISAKTGEGLDRVREWLRRPVQRHAEGRDSLLQRCEGRFEAGEEARRFLLRSGFVVEPAVREDEAVRRHKRSPDRPRRDSRPDREQQEKHFAEVRVLHARR